MADPVFLLVHDDRWYDMGDTYVRGVYRRREDAESDIVSRTPSGAKSRAYGAHNEQCCSVDEWDVADQATPDVAIDQPPADPANRIIPDHLVTGLLRDSIAKSPPLRSIRRK